jgi:hypothetical protein
MAAVGRFNGTLIKQNKFLILVLFIILFNFSAVRPIKKTRCHFDLTRALGAEKTLPVMVRQG